MRKLVSIIVPVYNTEEELLKTCINSLCKQTYEAIEIIIVDDGSNKVIRMACDTLATSDSRIRVIHKENGGVSRARNIGTHEAIGEYIMYMDSDDLLASFAIEEGMDAAIKNDADYVFGALKTINTHSEFDMNLNTIRVVKIYQKKELDFVRKGFMTQRVSEFRNIKNNGFINRGPCVRLIKSDIAKRVLFDEELVLGEDVEWNMRILNECSIVCFVPNVWYGYLKYTNSSLNRYYGNRAELLEKYHLKLYEENKSYFDNHMDEYGINLAVSFYKMLICEYMSTQCPLTRKEKVKSIRMLLKREPWKLLTKKNIYDHLTLRYKILVTSCNIGLEFELLKLWYHLKEI